MEQVEVRTAFLNKGKLQNVCPLEAKFHLVIPVKMIHEGSQSCNSIAYKIIQTIAIYFIQWLSSN